MQKGATMRTILLVILILLLLGALLLWPYSAGLGYYPGGALGLILIVLIILMVLGRIWIGRGGGTSYRSNVSGRQQGAVPPS
jgi:hypothetical protein